MRRSRVVVAGMTASVLAAGSVVAATSTAAPSRPAPSAGPGVSVDREVEQNLGRSLVEAAKKQPPAKAKRARAELEATASRHRGRVTAAEARSLIREAAPSLAVEDQIVPAREQITGVLGDRVLQVKRPGGKGTQVLQSNLPLAKLISGSRKSGTAKYRVVDLDWESAGDRFTIKDPVGQVSLPRQAGGQVRLGDDVSLRLAPEGSEAVGTPSKESVTYPNIATDTDMTVRSLPTGFGVGWTLRSPAALRTLRVPVDLPDGQRLKKRDNGSVLIVDDDDEAVTELTPAVASDADRQSVPLETEIDGSAIVYKVDHTEGEVAYPIAVDPYTTLIGEVNHGWRAQNTPQPNAPYEYFGSSTTAGTLSIFAPPGIYAQYESAAWARFAPGLPATGRPSAHHARWTSFTAGGVSYSWYGQQWYHVYNRAYGKVFAADSNGTIQQPPVDVPAGTSGGMYTVTPTGGPSNQIGFGLTLDGGFFFQNDHPQAGINMAWYTATAADDKAPEGWTDYEGQWVDPETTPTIPIRSLDYGLGVKSFELRDVSGAKLGDTTTYICTPSGDQICPFVSDYANAPIAGATEGDHYAKVWVRDGGGKEFESPIKLKIDRTAPELTLGGSMITQQEQALGSTEQRELIVTSNDGTSTAKQSGVAKIEIYKDGQLVYTKNQGSTADSAGLTVNQADWYPPRSFFTDTEGGSEYLMEVVATDRLGHEKNGLFRVKTPPTELAPENETVNAEASQYIQGRDGLSAAQAANRLADQNRSEVLHRKLEDALAENYVGMWADRAADRIKVAVTNSVAQSTIDSAVSDAGLIGKVDVTRRTANWSQLVAAKASADDQLQGLVSGGKLTIDNDPASGKLDFEQATSLTQQERSQIEGVVNGLGVPVNLINAEWSETSAEPLACSGNPSWGCDPPFRGGVNMWARRTDDGANSCTSGFMARRNSDRRLVVITAGHCFDQVSGGSMWHGANNGDWAELGFHNGNKIFDRRGDMGYILVNTTSPFYRSGSNILRVYADAQAGTTRDPNYRINEVRYTPNPEKRKNFVLCIGGSSLGDSGLATPRSRCGVVEKTGVSKKTGGVTVDHLGLLNVCHGSDQRGGKPGMSGGPVFKDHVAYGIVSALDKKTIPLLGSSTDPCKVYYQGAPAIERLMGVRILRG